jgi:hypothetical protein
VVSLVPVNEGRRAAVDQSGARPPHSKELKNCFFRFEKSFMRFRAAFSDTTARRGRSILNGFHSFRSASILFFAQRQRIKRLVFSKNICIPFEWWANLFLLVTVPAEYYQHRTQHDLQVKQQGPIFDIEQVELDHLFE